MGAPMVTATVLGSETSPPVPAVPKYLGIRLRPETDGDESFLRALYRSARHDEMRRAGLDPVAMQPFLDSQFDLQRRHYRLHYAAGGAFSILMCRRKREPVGRLYTHESPGDLRVVDISLMPGRRGQGLGTGLLTALQALAAQRTGRLSLHVDPANRAAALYERLGFRIVDTAGMSWRMEWRPGQNQVSGTVKGL